MAFLTDADRARIAAAVKAAERRTSAEFVTVIAPASHTYVLVPVLYATAFALLLPGALWLAGVLYEFVWLYAAQLGAFAAALVVLRWQPLALRLVPDRVQRRYAGHRAREQFLARGLHRTAARNGVLLFVSVAEHYVEIIADSATAEAVSDEEWAEIVAAFTARVKAGRAAEGFEAAIAAIADRLAARFPRDPADRNELPDRLVELP